MRNDVWQEVEKGKRPEANFKICRNRFYIFNDSADLKDLLFNEFQNVSLVAGINFHKINAVFELADIVSE